MRSRLYESGAVNARRLQDVASASQSHHMRWFKALVGIGIYLVREKCLHPLTEPPTQSHFDRFSLLASYISYIEAFVCCAVAQPSFLPPSVKTSFQIGSSLFEIRDGR